MKNNASNMRQSAPVFSTALPNCTIKFSRGSNTFDNLPDQKEVVSWQDFWEFIEKDRGTAKGQQYICAAMAKGLNTSQPNKYKGEAPWRQAHLSEESVFLPFDFDFIPVDMYDPLINALSEYAGCSYHTSSHTPEKPRVRSFIALSRPVTRVERIRLGYAFERFLASRGILGIGYDDSVYNSEQACYLPTKGSAFSMHDGTWGVDVDALLNSEFSMPEDAHGKFSAGSCVVPDGFNATSLDDQQELCAKIKSGLQAHKETGKAKGYDSPEAQKLADEVNSLGAELNWCWVFDDQSLAVVCAELTKDDVNRLNRGQWVSRVMLAARFAPIRSDDAEQIKSAVCEWSQKHKCYEGFFPDGNNPPEYESCGNREDPFKDFDDRWSEGEHNLRVDNTPFKKLWYLAKNRQPVPQVLLVDGSLYAQFDTQQETAALAGPSSLSINDLFADLALNDADVQAMEESVFIVPNLIVRGHLIAIIAEANGGKTALMVHQAAKLSELGYDVLYINVDASPGDLKRHHIHAKTHGYKVIAPDAKLGKNVLDAIDGFKKAADNGIDLSRTVIILDTLKKFTDVIQKRQAKEFYDLMRKLTVFGATIIMLGHANKYRTEDGKMIYEGTADLRNDVDELIYLNSIKNEETNRLEITTYPDKVRADFEPRSFFINLSDRSVEEPNEVVQILDKERQQALRCAKEAISSGITGRSELVAYIREQNGNIGKNKAIRFLDDFTHGATPKLRVSRGDKNAIIYSIFPPPDEMLKVVLENWDQV